MKRIVISATAILLAAFLVLSTVPAVFAANTEPLDIFTGPEADSASSSAPDTASSAPGLSPIELGNLVTGVWEGSVPIFTSEKTYFNDRVTFDFNTDREEDLLLRFRSLDPDTFFPPNEWRAEGGALTFSFYDSPWRAEFALRPQSEGILTGTFTQYGKSANVTFTKVSSSPAAEGEIQTQFVFDGKTGDEWLAELRKYPSFSMTGEKIPFTYELNRADKSLPMVNLYGVTEGKDGRTDVEQMKALLDIVSKNFTHNGSVAVPEQLDPLSVIAYHNEHGGIECRGLSVILAEMLRVCGIPAKPVMCISSIEPSECHVVVHAYSESLEQWIMLDPTYHLMLKNEKGQYVSLPMLRDALISGETLIPNDDAGHNGQPFYMPYYRAYMAKNTFRFACATDFYFGGERFADTDVKGEGSANAAELFGASSHVPATEEERKAILASNTQNMLVPIGYDVPYRYSRTEKLTTYANGFWAAP